PFALRDHHEQLVAVMEVAVYVPERRDEVAHIGIHAVVAVSARISLVRACGGIYRVLREMAVLLYLAVLQCDEDAINIHPLPYGEGGIHQRIHARLYGERAEIEYLPVVAVLRALVYDEFGDIHGIAVERNGEHPALARGKGIARRVGVGDGRAYAALRLPV